MSPLAQEPHQCIQIVFFSTLLSTCDPLLFEFICSANGISVVFQSSEIPTVTRGRHQSIPLVSLCLYLNQGRKEMFSSYLLLPTSPQQMLKRAMGKLTYTKTYQQRLPLRFWFRLFKFFFLLMNQEMRGFFSCTGSA